MAQRKWIGVDLDGTLAELTDDANGSIGSPVGPMAKRVKDWIAAGKEVRIVTARAADASQVGKVQSWLKQHGFGDLAVTNAKDANMIELWDDRAVKVKRNAGTPCPGCLKLKRAGYSADGFEDHDTEATATDC